jgi:hypothetical protein
MRSAAASADARCETGRASRHASRARAAHRAPGHASWVHPEGTLVQQATQHQVVAPFHPRIHAVEQLARAANVGALHGGLGGPDLGQHLGLAHPVRRLRRSAARPLSRAPGEVWRRGQPG